MKKWLTITVLLMAMIPATAEPSLEHLRLSEAAEFAVERENVELLRALLQAGVQINEPVNTFVSENRTLLHCAVMLNTPRSVQFLLDNGANLSLDARDKNGQRPIDYALEKENTTMCQLLTKPDNKDESYWEICGFPIEVLEEVINPWAYLRGNMAREPLFVSFNGTNAPTEFIEWFGKYFPDLRPYTQAELSEEERDENGRLIKTGHIRDKDTKEKGYIFSIRIEKINDGYEHAKSMYGGPLNANPGGSGKLIRKYGYWVWATDEASGDEL